MYEIFGRYGNISTHHFLVTPASDAVYLRDESLQRLPDNEVLAKAAMENRVLLTMDLDFGYLVAISKQILPGVIIFRLSDERSEMVNSRLSEVLVKCAYDIQPGLIISVSDRTIRIRRLPI